MRASWGVVVWANAAGIPQLRFLEDARYERTEFEDERLGRDAEALQEQAAERQRWRERRAEGDQAGEAADDDGRDQGDALDVGQP